MKKILAVTAATAGLALSGLVLPAVATAAPTGAGEGSQAAACSKWIDYTDRGRAHASCSGVDVKVYVKCANGRTYGSEAWRWGYNKAECPRGIGATSMSVQTR